MFTSSSIFHPQLLLSFCRGVCHQGCQSKSSYCPMSAKQHAPIHLLHHQKELGRTNRSLPSVLLSWVGRDNPSKTFWGILSGIDCLWKQPPCISLQTYCSGWPLTITNRCTGVWPSTISKIWLYCGRSSGHWKMLALFVVGFSPSLCRWIWSCSISRAVWGASNVEKMGMEPNNR